MSLDLLGVWWRNLLWFYSCICYIYSVISQMVIVGYDWLDFGIIEAHILTNNFNFKLILIISLATTSFNHQILIHAFCWELKLAISSLNKYQTLFHKNSFSKHTVSLGKVLAPVMAISYFFPIPLSTKVTERIPSASISHFISIWGTPCGMTSKWKLPRDLLSLTNSLTLIEVNFLHWSIHLQQWKRKQPWFGNR